MAMEEKVKPIFVEGVGWRLEKKPSMLRRMEEHDYRGRSIYMITLVTEGRKPILGRLQWPDGRPEEAYVALTALGALVERCWESIPEHYPEVKPLALQLMPDHLHGLLFVQKEQKAHLGQVVNGFKIGCNKAMRALTGSNERADCRESVDCREAMPHGTEPPGQPHGTESDQNLQKGKLPKHPEKGMLFAPGYQDSVLTGKGQLESMFAYIADNPRRLAMKRLNPERFRIQNIRIAGRECQMVGNRYLLDIADKRAVIVHRRYTDEENARLKEEWLACGERGGVLVSAAIAPKEKEVLREAMDRGYKIILLRENGFSKLYKPSGEAFDACVEGRLLQISPWEYHMEKKTISRAQCLELNIMAESIAGNGCLQT